MRGPADSDHGFWASAGRPQFLAVFLAIWSALVLFGGIPYGDLSGYDDAVYAHEVREMARSGDIWTLSLNGSPDFDKPPLYIWLVAISFKIFGVSDLSAKIPGALFGLGTILLIYFLVQELDRDDESAENEWLPAAAMFCMATTQYFLKYSSHAMTDVPFTFLFLLAIYFYVRSLRSSGWLLASGVATGLAMLTRSPVGLFPIAIVGAHAIFSRRVNLRSLPYFAGFVLLAIAVPAVWYFREYSLFGQVFLIRHFSNILAHSSSSADRSAIDRLPGYFEYIKLLAKQYWPWFPFMCVGLIIAAKRSFKGRDQAAALLLIWVAVVVVPLSFADAKVLRYILPAFPAFAVVSAWSLTALLPPRWLPALSRSFIIILSIVAAVTIVSPRYIARADDIKIIAPVADAATRSDESVVLYTAGEFQWNYANQLFWYGNRHCDHIKDLTDLQKLQAERKTFVLIIDKPSYSKVMANTDVTMTLLGESTNFVCLRID